MARNPKDVIVSYYYYHKLMDYQQYTGNIETFAQYFIDDKSTSRLFLFCFCFSMVT